jgi:hypothetical protein
MTSGHDVLLLCTTMATGLRRWWQTSSHHVAERATSRCLAFGGTVANLRARARLDKLVVFELAAGADPSAGATTLVEYADDARWVKKSLSSSHMESLVGAAARTRD